ncbi:GLE1-like protein-domain-containing protein [Phycomyces nitens]|nr:GLE1-like protein-domain-containing protein [Phycomyces nitens]
MSISESQLDRNTIKRGFFAPNDSDSESEDEQFYTQSQSNTVSNLSRGGGCIPTIELKADLLDRYNEWEIKKRNQSYGHDEILQKQFERLALQRAESLRKSQQQILESNNKQMNDIKKAVTEWISKDKLLHNVSKSPEDTFLKEKEARNKRIEDAIRLEKENSEKKSKANAAKAAAKAKEEEEKANAEKAKAKAEQDKIQAEKALQVKKAAMKHSSVYSAQGLEEYNEYFETIKIYRELYKPALMDDTFRKSFFKVKKDITRNVSQLQYKPSVVLEKAKNVFEIVDKTRNQSKEAFNILLNHLAKVILLQAEQEIAATPMAAYFLGRFATLITGHIPELFPYLIARLYKRAPILIPHYHDGNPDLSADELRTLMRYKYEDKRKQGIFESYEKYELRQNSYVMFFAGWLQVEPGPGQPANMLSIGKGWVWLARICNMPPRNVTASILRSFLEVAGQRLLREYPTQMPKIMQYLQTVMLPLIQRDTTNQGAAGKIRLEVYLTECAKANNIIAIPDFIEKKM